MLEIDGIIYVKQPEQTADSCRGCAAQSNDLLCQDLQRNMRCYDQSVIWVRQPQSPHLDEILCILQEECAEVVQAVSKVRRFGFLSSHPQRSTTNKEELEEELGDLLAMIQLLQDSGFIDPQAVQAHKHNKISKLERYSNIYGLQHLQTPTREPAA